MKKLLNTILLGLILMAISISIILNSSYTDFTIKENNLILLVEKGDNIKKISEKLYLNKVNEYKLFIYIIMRIYLKDTIINLGEYEIIKGEDIFDLIKKLKTKQHYYRKITFVEGETIEKYKSQINSAFGLLGSLTEQMEEGYFMPGTYNYLYGETKNSLAKRAREDMVAFVNLEFSKIENKNDFYLKNINEILSLASVVEKETGIGLERKLVAGVFFNRLKQGMKLQSDPTVVYEITKGKYKLERPLTYLDLTIVGSYNTYYIKGIPKSPIASPSKEAIMAVLYPKETDSLFFVADGLGGHNFSKSYQEHLENVKIYRQSIKKDGKK
jgi:UPF0755 protein